MQSKALKHNTPYKPALLLICSLLILLQCGALHAAENHRVVVVHSYNPDYIWTQQINIGIQDGLAGLGVVDKTFYMDAKRRPSSSHLEKAALEALQYIDTSAPEVVICVDDAAQAYLAAKFLKGRERPQVIFCGVNAPLEKYGYPASNVSGVRERWHYRDAFALMKKIQPTAKSVAFLVEDSESGGYVLNDLLEEQRKNGPFALEIAGAETIATLSQWKERIHHYNETADVLALGLYNSLYNEESGKVAPPAHVMEWTNSVLTKPTIGFSDIAKKDGLLCGILESGHEQGLLAGQMAREILTQEKNAGMLPVRINTKGVVFINLNTGENLGMHIPYRFIEAADEIMQ